MHACQPRYLESLNDYPTELAMSKLDARNFLRVGSFARAIFPEDISLH